MGVHAMASSGGAHTASPYGLFLRPQAGGQQQQAQQPQQQPPPEEMGGSSAGLSPEAMAWEKVEWLAAQVADAAANPYP